MIVSGPTHATSPFVGRSRELGIVTHLIHQGLAGRLSLVRVAGPVGIGRRRFLAEALRRGPDAEWIHLAPGGVEPDFRRWIQSELHDLLESYPSAPVPSWALHILSRWSASLAIRAAVPARSREMIPESQVPVTLGRAIGAVLTSLTGETPIIVDTGLWPRRGPDIRTLEALIGCLDGAGMVAVAATDPSELRGELPGQRTLLLEPLEPEAIRHLLDLWKSGSRADAAGAWLGRVTGGHPFHLHETIRWLEETGHVRVVDGGGRVEFLDAVDRLPLPMNLAAILELRFRRLPPEAARLLALIAQEDGRLDLESLRERIDDDESFAEGLASLRRREFLYRRSTRRPLALASPLWRPLARTLTLRFPRPEREAWEPAPEVTPLARTVDLLEAMIQDRTLEEDVPALRAEIARAVRRARGRPGSAWDGVRGRAALLAARRRLHDGRPLWTLRWVEWGLDRLDPARHPALRRALAALGAQANEILGRPREAQHLRALALEEAQAAGHELAAGRLEAIVAEGARRWGDTAGALEHATRALTQAETMGLAGTPHLAEFTRTAALLDARDLDAVRLALSQATYPASVRGLAARCELLTTAPANPRAVLPDPDGPPRGWGWGLDGELAWRSTVRRAAVAFAPATDAIASDELLTRELHTLEAAGYLGAAADIAEARLLAALGSGALGLKPFHLGDPVRILRSLGAEARLRWLAQILSGSPASAHPVYPDLYGPYLLQVVGTVELPGEPVLRLVLTGRPRVEHGTGVWPRSMWPEWWAALWGEAMSALVCGVELTREDLESRLRGAADLPQAPLESVLHEASERLRGTAPVLGGLELRRGMLAVEWDGLSSDIRDALSALDAAQTATSPGSARADYGRALSRIEGEYLPGMESPGVVAARAVLRDRLSEALRTALYGEESVPPSTLAAWLEGPVRLVGPAGVSLVREFMSRQERRWIARAFPLASP